MRLAAASLHLKLALGGHFGNACEGQHFDDLADSKILQPDLSAVIEAQRIADKVLPSRLACTKIAPSSLCRPCVC